MLPHWFHYGRARVARFRLSVMSHPFFLCAHRTPHLKKGCKSRATENRLFVRAAE